MPPKTSSASVKRDIQRASIYILHWKQNLQTASQPSAHRPLSPKADVVSSSHGVRGSQMFRGRRLQPTTSLELVATDRPGLEDPAGHVDGERRYEAGQRPVSRSRRGTPREAEPRPRNLHRYSMKAVATTCWSVKAASASMARISSGDCWGGATARPSQPGSAASVMARRDGTYSLQTWRARG